MKRKEIIFLFHQRHTGIRTGEQGSESLSIQRGARLLLILSCVIAAELLREKDFS